MLGQEYLSSAVSVLANSLKFYDQSKAVFFQLNLPEIFRKKDNSGALLLSTVFLTR